MRSAFIAVKGDDALLLYDSGTTYLGTATKPIYVEFGDNIYKTITTEGPGVDPPSGSWILIGGTPASGVTSITFEGGLTGGTITSSGNVGLSTTGVSPGSFTLANITVDNRGRITSAASGTAVTSVAAGAGLSGGTITTTGTISLPVIWTGGTFTLSTVTIDTFGRVTAASSGAGGGAVSSIATNAGITGGTITTTGTLGLSDTGVLANTYSFPTITVDAKGRITSATSNSPNPGTVSSIQTINGISGGTITLTGTIGLSNSGVAPGSYTNTNLTVDKFGRITSAANGSGGSTLPGGANTEVQYNAAGAFAANSGLTFNAITGLLTTKNFNISLTPSTGTTGDQLLTRDSVTGSVRRISQSLVRTLPAGSTTQLQYNNAGVFGADSQFVFDSGSKAVTLGARSGGTGTNSFVLGGTNRANGLGSMAIGSNAKADAAQSFAHGFNVTASNLYSEAANFGTIASGIYSQAEGFFTVASGLIAHAEGGLTIASGKSTHAGGLSDFTGKEIIAGGQAAFNHSYNNNSQVAGHGAIAVSSAILGGQNHNIAVGNVRAAIIGGNGIKLTGTTYIDTTAVPSLAIFTTPAGGGVEDVLTWNPVTKKINKVTQASIGGGGATLPAGIDTQVQFNNAGAFGAAAGFTYTNGTQRLATNNFAINTAPASGTSVQILTRNTGTGVIERINPGAIASPPLNAIQYRTTSGFGGDANWLFDATNDAVTLGTRTGGTGGFSITVGTNIRASALGSVAFGLQTKADGLNAFAIGQSTTATGGSAFSSGVLTRAWGAAAHAEGSQTLASGNQSHAEGISTTASGGQAHTEGQGTTASALNSHAEGLNSIASGTSSHAEGNATRAGGIQSHAEGQLTFAMGDSAHAEGQITRANGIGAHSGGRGFLPSSQVLADAIASFNHSSNTVAQVVGHGALADNSAILGGTDHNIEIGNVRAVVLGGTGIKLTGTSYVNHTAVANLAIMTAPATGIAADLVLVRNATTGRIRTVAQPTPAGSNTQVQYNNSGAFGASGNFIFEAGFGAVSIGTRTGTTGSFSFTAGQGNRATVSSSTAIGRNTKADGTQSFASGNFTRASGVASSVFGSLTLSSGAASHAEGTSTFASGSSAHAEGESTNAFGNQSHAEGLFTYAGGVASHAEGSQGFALGTASHAQGSNSRAVGDYSHAGGLGLPTKESLASGQAAFNHSFANAGQTAGHGAIANHSAILGGVNHNIETGNLRAAIIGGNQIKLTGTSYIDHTAMSNLAIMATPTTGIATDNVLVRSATTGRIRQVTQASISDERLKKNLFTIDGAVNKIASLNGYEYQYNDKFKNIEDTFDYGLIAQEVEQVFPHVVKNNFRIEGDDTVYKTIEYRKLVPVLFAAIKELNERIKTLESK